MTVLRGQLVSERCYTAERLLRERSGPEKRPSPHDQEVRLGRMAALARTIEREIIPRLMLVHRFDVPEPRKADPLDGVEPDEVADFAGLLLSYDEHVALASIEARRAEGVALESVFLDLLAPAARHLGDLWKSDLCDFTDVTVGLSRLHQIVRVLSADFGREAAAGGPGRSALIATVPGEQHIFGSVLVDEFLRRDGWDVVHVTGVGRAELVALAAGEWFEVVGLSVSSDRLIADLPSLIASLRQSSLNPDLWVMVGGRPFVEDADLARQVGADATAIDGRQVIRQTRHLWKSRPAVA